MKNNNSYLKSNAYNGRANWGKNGERGVGAIRGAVRTVIRNIIKSANAK